jgi:hypothetical protein
MSDATMLKRIKQLTGDPKMTVHGVRGTFRTWAQEETDFEEEIVEHCMHHITGDAAEKTFKHGQALKKRRVVLQAFALRLAAGSQTATGRLMCGKPARRCRNRPPLPGGFFVPRPGGVDRTPTGGPGLFRFKFTAVIES